ncbi:MAG: hypothetical protein ACRDJI_00635, partial [Actinomycetota bacterium]
VVEITNCRNDSTSGKPGRLVDLSRAEEVSAMNINGKVSEGIIEVGWRTIVKIERRLSATY